MNKLGNFSGTPRFSKQQLDLLQIVAHLLSINIIIKQNELSHLAWNQEMLRPE